MIDGSLAMHLACLYESIGQLDKTANDSLYNYWTVIALYYENKYLTLKFLRYLVFHTSLLCAMQLQQWCMFII